MINDTDGRKGTMGFDVGCGTEKMPLLLLDGPCEGLEDEGEYIALSKAEIAEINARQAEVVERYRDQRIKHMIQGQAMVASFVISQGGAVNPDDMLRQCDLTLDQIIEAEADDHDINIIRDYLNPQEG